MAQPSKGEVMGRRFSFFSGTSSPWAPPPLAILFFVAAALLALLRPATPEMAMIPVCLVLGAVIFIPWGLQAQACLCLVATLSYTIAVYPDFTPQAARDYVFAYLSLSVSVLASLFGALRQKSHQAQ